MNKYLVFKLLWALIFVFLIVGYLFDKISLFVIFWALLVCLGLLSWASFDMRLQLFTPVFFKGKQGNINNLALTFDDGPTLFTPKILDLLEKSNCKATFFCIGQQIEKYPEIAKQIIASGHIIANHTYTHTTKMGFLSVEEVVQEIDKNQKLIKNLLNISPQWFRPPFGVTNPAIAKAITQNKMLCIGWNIRSLDTISKSAAEIFNRIQPKLKTNGIILLHDTSEKTVQALEQLLVEIKKQQFTVVPLDELIAEKAYKNEKNNFTI